MAVSEEEDNDTVAVSIDVSAYAPQQIGGTIPQRVLDNYKITGNIMDVVIAVLLAEDNWSSDWDHDDLDPERVNIEDEEE